jgi:hypothetical protein
MPPFLAPAPVPDLPATSGQAPTGTPGHSLRPARVPSSRPKHAQHPGRHGHVDCPRSLAGWRCSGAPPPLTAPGPAGHGGACATFASRPPPPAGAAPSDSDGPRAARARLRNRIRRLSWCRPCAHGVARVRTGRKRPASAQPSIMAAAAAAAAAAGSTLKEDGDG